MAWAASAGWVSPACDVAVMYEGAVQDLIDELGRLPGIGPKSAQRIAFHLLAAESVDVDRLAAVLRRVKAEVKFCRICGNVTDSDECRICRDPRRDGTVICVVEEPKDVIAVERTREFRAATTCWAVRSARSTASARTTCGCASCCTGSVTAR